MANITDEKGRPMTYWGGKRDESIMVDRKNGLLLTELASKYDLSRSRITHILKEQRLMDEIKRLKSNG